MACADKLKNFCLKILFFLFVLNALVKCSESPGSQGPTGADGTNGSAGMTPLYINLVSAYNTITPTLAANGPYCSAVWYNSSNRSNITSNENGDIVTSAASTSSHQTTATCLYTLTSARNINAYKCFSQTVLKNVLEGQIMQGDIAVGCGNGDTLTCTFFCWNNDGSGTLALTFSATP